MTINGYTEAMIEMTIQENDAGQRLDKYLQKTFPALPKSLMYKAIRNKKIKVNRKRCEISQKLVLHDQLQIFLPPDVLEVRSFVPEDKPLKIVYEDDQYLVVDKPAGLLSQKDEPGPQDTLNWRIQSYLYKRGQWDPAVSRSFVPAAAHRLDRNTSGLVISGKTAEAARHIAALIREGKMTKEYRALVEGRITAPMDVSLYVKKEGTLAVVSSELLKGYVRAAMKVIPEKTEGDNTWCHILMDTGRFHQIRACMAYLGHPLAGDCKYGSHPGRPYQLRSIRIAFDDIDVTS